MAVSRVGTAQLYQSSTQDTTHSVTVPDGCDCIIVAITGYQGGANTATHLVDELFFAGSGIDFSKIGFAQYGDGFNACQVDAYVMTSADADWPGTGAKTLAVRAPAAREEGFQVGVIYYSGVDQAAPIIGTDDHTGSDDGVSFTSSIGGVGVDDLGMVAAYRFGNAPTVSGGSQTTILTPAGNFNNAGFGVAEKAGTGTMVATAADHLVALAWALKAATEEEPTAIEGAATIEGTAGEATGSGASTITGTASIGGTAGAVAAVARLLALVQASVHGTAGACTAQGVLTCSGVGTISGSAGSVSALATLSISGTCEALGTAGICEALEGGVAIGPPRVTFGAWGRDADARRIVTFGEFDAPNTARRIVTFGEWK